MEKDVHEKIDDVKSNVRDAIKGLADIIPRRDFENLSEVYRIKVLDSLSKLTDIIGKI